MQIPPHQRSRFGWLKLALIIFTAVGMNYLGAFKATDQSWYDLCQRITAKSRASSHVVLVYADQSPERTDIAQLRNLLDQVDDCGPRQIGLVAEGLHLRREDVADLSCADHLVFGLELEEIQNGQSATGNQVDQRNNLSTGFTDLHLAGQSTYRTAILRSGSGAEEVFSFEAEIARRMLPSNDHIPSQPTGIRFGRGIDTIPHVNASSLLEGKVVPELLADKVVLIGLRRPPTYGLVTPTTSGNRRMSRLEVRANILETILREEGFVSAGAVASSLVLVLLIAGFWHVARMGRREWLRELFLLSILACGLISLATLYLLGIVLPFSASAVAVTATFGLMIWDRFRVASATTGFLKLMTSVNHVHEKPPLRDELWDRVGNAVFEMVYPRKLVLLELEPGTTHCRVAKTVNCDASAIHERRRDVQRSPYRDATDHGGPVEIETRRFLVHEDGEPAVEYIVPLTCGDDLLGFMLLSIARAQIESWNNFENFLSGLANEMAVRVADHRVVSGRANEKKNLLSGLWQVPERQEFNELQSELALQRDYNQRMERAFEVSGTGRAYCDTFGRIVKHNSRMVDFLHDRGIVASQTFCVEMLTALSGRPVTQCRELFREAISNGRSETLYVPAVGEDENSLLIFLKPVRRHDATEHADFVARGVIIEVVDGSVFEQADHWQKKLTIELAEDATSRIESLQQQARRLAEGTNQSDSLEALFGSFGETVEEVLSVLQDCQEISRCRITADPASFLEIDTGVIWQSTVDTFRGRLEDREIGIESTFADSRCAAIANPLLLEELFSTILEILIANAIDGSTIHVHAGEVDDRMHFRFINGSDSETPVKDLQRVLQPENEESVEPVNARAGEVELLDPRQLDRLGRVRSWLEQWDGTLVIQNGSQYGVDINLVLQTTASRENTDDRRSSGVPRSG